MLGTSGAGFVKSSYSHPGDCIEVAIPPAGAVAVRDSKDPNGPRLVVTRAAWAEFVQFAAGHTV